MAYSETPNLQYRKPATGDTGWGTELNFNFDSLDDDVQAAKDTSAAALPKAGGEMTGRVDLFSSTAVLVDLGSLATATDIDLSTGNVFKATITGATQFSFTVVPSGTWMTGFILYLTNGGVNVTWPGSVDWPGGIAPILQSAGIDVLVFTTINDGGTWHGVLASGDSK